MMAQNAVAGATAPASGAGIGCWSFQTPGPVSSRSSGGKADGGLPSRSGIATGTGPRGRRTQSLPVRTLLGLLPGHPCPCSYPSAHFERRSLLLLNSAAFPLSASTRFTITCGCPPRCVTISAWCFCSPSAFRLSVACPGSTLPLRRLILGPVTATWTPYGRHNKYPRLTLPST